METSTRARAKLMVVVPSAVICGRSATAIWARQIRDGGAVLQGMHDRYQNNWYETLTFQQDYVRHDADRTDKTEIWYEALMVPGKLRIDIGRLDSGNGVLVTDGALTPFQNNEVTAGRPRCECSGVLG